MITTAELIRRGAAILQEPCPRCGAVQIRYKGRIYCTNEDDLNSVLNSVGAAELSSTQIKTGLSNEEKPSTGFQVSQSSDSLRKLLEEKLNTVSKQLDSTTDLIEQAKLLDLISKYIETLEKLKKSAS
jgi:uncharacterized Zn finger protein (UPF0148 family)